MNSNTNISPDQKRRLTNMLSINKVDQIKPFKQLVQTAD